MRVLFNLSFDEFITPTIVSVLYALNIVAAALVALGVFTRLATGEAGAAVVGLILAPIVFFLWILLARVLLETTIVLFRIAENTKPGTEDRNA
jgi:hypothetical protein